MVSCAAGIVKIFCWIFASGKYFARSLGRVVARGKRKCARSALFLKYWTQTTQTTQTFKNRATPNTCSWAERGSEKFSSSRFCDASYQSMWFRYQEWSRFSAQERLKVWTANRVLPFKNGYSGMLSNTLECFYTLSYAFIRFHMLSYAFICFRTLS